MTVNNPESQGHPAWQEYLEGIPESLQPLVKSAFEKWDQNVQQKLQDERSKYAGFEDYKPIVEQGVDPNVIQQALFLLESFQKDPEDATKQAIEVFGLDYVKPSQVPQQANQVDDFVYGNDDINNHPMFKQLQDKLAEFEQRFQTQEEREEQQQAVKQWNDALEAAEKTHGEFDKTYVTALASQGLNLDQAISQWKETIGKYAQLGQNTQQQDTQQPPVVMGGDGATGSGLPQQPVKFGDMRAGDTEDTVVAMLRAAQQANNQG